MTDATPPMPHNREAEEAIVGSVLINPDVYEEVTGFLRAADFHIVHLRWIWEAFDRLRNKQAPIDILTVTEEMDRQKQLAEAGGPAYLTSLLNRVPTTLHAEAYARSVANNSLRRRLLTAAATITRTAYDRSLEIEQVMTTVDKAITEAQERTTTRDNLAAAHVLSEVYDQAAEQARHPNWVWGMSTGLPEWDALTGGLHRGQTTLISAPPGMGKTTLVMQVARNIAARTGVLIHELEMDRCDLGAKLFASECGITIRQLKSGFVPSDKWEAMLQTMTHYEKEMRLVINDTPGLTTAQLRANLARLSRRMEIGLLVVDYVNLLADHDSRDDYENAALKLRRLRDIAREFNVALLTIQSMNKEGMNSPIPDLSGVSGRADLVFDADNVFFMIKDQGMERAVMLLPAKLRHGDGKKEPFDLIWDAELPKFNSVARLP
jgi:replicative DNA helicase